ncbi:MAG: iron hydrogenase [Deltaproteobacteria bacterium]|nr:MAG: iron hydrogenase [Deltaproteobacteria bacterium]
MSLSRRDFLKICGTSSVALGFSQMMVPGIVNALEKALSGNPPVIWIQGSGCSGCSVSILNAVHPTIQEVLLKIISLKVHPTVMAAQGTTVLEVAANISKQFKGKFFLVVEGSIPTAANGKYCVVGELGGKSVTMLGWTKDLASKAKAAIAVGSCASYGGIPAAQPNPTKAQSLIEILNKADIKTPVINIPGCPPHPDWMVGTLAYVLLYGIPELDENNRPTLFYGTLVHDHCPYRSYYEEGKFAKYFGDEGCRYELGCKGPETYCDTWKRKFNNGTNWCVQNAICIGCVQPKFWDEFSPFYEAL